MAYAHLTAAQRAEIGHLIRRHGWDDPLEAFEWRSMREPIRVAGKLEFTDDNSRRRAPRVVHRETGFFFQFGYSDHWQKHAYSCSPGPEALHYRDDNAKGWEEVLRAVDKWLGNVRRELEAADYWEPIEAPPLGRALPPTRSREADPFDASEIERIVAALDAGVRELIEAGAVSEVHEDDLRAEVEELKDGLRKVNRGVWLRWATGAVVQMVWRGVLAAPQAERMLGRVWDVIAALLNP